MPEAHHDLLLSQTQDTLIRRVACSAGARSQSARRAGCLTQAQYKHKTVPMNPPNIHTSSRISVDVLVDDKAWIGPNCHLEGSITIEAGVVLKGGITLIGEVMIGRNSL